MIMNCQILQLLQLATHNTEVQPKYNPSIRAAYPGQANQNEALDQNMNKYTYQR